MKKRVLALCLASFFSVNAFALVPPGNDVTTKPDLYYLTNAQAIDSLALLPPPPAVGSIAFLNDQAMYEQGRLLRNTERGKLAGRGCQPQRGRRSQRLLQRLWFADHRERRAAASQTADQYD